jgi:hypothetical protein
MIAEKDEANTHSERSSDWPLIVSRDELSLEKASSWQSVSFEVAEERRARSKQRLPDWSIRLGQVFRSRRSEGKKSIASL